MYVGGTGPQCRAARLDPGVPDADGRAGYVMTTTGIHPDHLQTSCVDVR